MSGGWGWDGNALPIGTGAQAGGVGRRASLLVAQRGWGDGARPQEGRGGGRGKGVRGGARRQGLPGTPPPPFTQRGPGTPLPASATESVQACGLRSSHRRRGGSVGPGSSGGRRPSCPHQPGCLGDCQAKAMATRWLLCRRAAPAPRLVKGKGAGAVRRRRPQGL